MVPEAELRKGEHADLSFMVMCVDSDGWQGVGKEDNRGEDVLLIVYQLGNYQLTGFVGSATGIHCNDFLTFQ